MTLNTLQENGNTPLITKESFEKGLKEAIQHSNLNKATLKGISSTREKFNATNFFVGSLDNIDNFIPNTSARFEAELRKRKTNLDLLFKGQEGLTKVQELDKEIRELELEILKHKYLAFKNGKETNKQELILARKYIEELRKQKDTLLQTRETATAYELAKIIDYREQFEKTGFIMTSSRQKLVDEAIEKLILGENVMFAGSTGGGKTVLATQITRLLSKFGEEVVEINGVKLEKELSKEFREYIISGSSGLTVGDLVGKFVLTEKNGAPVTNFELGKLLKAWQDGQIVIFDEIDVVGNDILMRIKHLFTKKPGSKYFPQEDGDTEVVLKTTGMIATANIKGEKHSDRNELDNAILRLFNVINVSQVPKEEMLEMAKAMLANELGFIEGIGKEELAYGEKEEGKSIIFYLIKAIKDIQDNYLGKTVESSTSGGKSSLNKAIFEMGNFVSLLNGFRNISGSKEYFGLDFNAYVKRRVIEFVTRPGYPKKDRIILLKIFSSNGLITRDDEKLILDRMEDISPEEFKSNVLDANLNFSVSQNSYLDPYELANIDPYKVRNLNKLGFGDKRILIKNTLQEILREIITIDGLNELQIKISSLIDNLRKDSNFEVQISDWEEIIGGLSDKDLGNVICRLFESSITVLSDIAKKAVILKAELFVDIGYKPQYSKEKPNDDIDKGGLKI